MDLRQLKCFVAAAERLNFTKAAEQLRVAQPALSRQIRSLEEELGLTLLERDSRRVALTPAGVVFLEDAREILERAEAAEMRIKRFHREARQTITLGYTPTLAGQSLPRLVRRLALLAPKFQLDLRDLSNREMVEAVRDRTLDAALLPQGAVPVGEVFSVEPLSRLDFAVALPSGHPLTRRRSISVADLAQENLIAYERRAYADYWVLLKAIYKAAKRPLIVSAEVDGGATLMASVASGQGVAVVTSTMGTAALPGLKFRTLGTDLPGFRLALLHHRDLPAQVATRLRQVCREIFPA